MKKITSILFTLFMAANLMGLPVIAEARSGKCSGSGSGSYSGKFEDKVYKKMFYIYANKEELGISEKQEEALKKMKITLKKDMAKKGYQIEEVSIDIKAMLWEDNFDIKAVNELVDKKYAYKSEKAKLLVKAISDLKTLLTEDQQAKVKNICLKNMGK